METGVPIDSLTPEKVAQTHGPLVAEAFAQNRAQALTYYRETSHFDTLPAETIAAQVESLRPKAGRSAMDRRTAIFRRRERRLRRS